MTVYNIIYFTVWLLALLSYCKGFSSNALYRVQSLIIILFASIRFQTGYDWPVYEEHYNSLSSGSVFSLSFEFGYEYIVRVFNYLGISFPVFSFFITFIQVFLITKSIKFFFPKHSLLILATMYALPDFYLIPVFSLMRQGMAVSLFFWGMSLYFSHKKKLSYMAFFLAVSFHYSTLSILLLVFLLFKFTSRRSVYLTVFSISIIAYLLSIDMIGWIGSIILPMVGDKYSIYLERDVYNASLVYRLCYSLAMTLFFSIIYRTCYVDDRKNDNEIKFDRRIYKLAFMGIIIPVALYAFPTVSTRFQYFFSIFSIGICFHAYEIFKRNNHVIISIFLAIIFYMPFYRFLIDPLSLVYTPYQDLFFYDEDSSTGKIRTTELLNQLHELWSKK
ncbi:EpsG family protein [Serratia sp. UGAL515B_01]|uniref:EpsG family protein n=1 Tax=Serratia sp. UGAL515B_01 TaxID=2986763 RepID=UPI0029546504|nr:EpsG family protein [Serratia sp. UGAL515B_01]WON76293.1 EpsG family protein [Serratia sp. UGAL515B_01]